MDEESIDPGEIIREQRMELERVTREEAWFLGEEFNRFVHPHEWDVQLRVADIWLKSGQVFREQAIQRIRSREPL